MQFTSLLAYVGAFLCGVSVVVVMFEKKRSFVQWLFAAGMGVLGLEAMLIAFSAQSTLPLEVVFWQRLRFIVVAFLPGIWLVFSLSFAPRRLQEIHGKMEMDQPCRLRLSRGAGNPSWKAVFHFPARLRPVR